MKINVGRDDRIIRIVIGLGFISMVFWGPETNWGWVGLLPLATGLVGFCALYTKLGFNTANKSDETENTATITEEKAA